jgi:DNA-binding SARP family transcriptional activator
MMRGHYQRGDRPAALRQFIQCKEQLRRELMIEPMAETIALYEAIRAENDAEILRRAVARHGSRGRVHSRHSGATAISTFGAAPHKEVPGVQPTRRETGGK